MLIMHLLFITIRHSICRSSFVHFVLFAACFIAQSARSIKWNCSFVGRNMLLCAWRQRQFNNNSIIYYKYDECNSHIIRLRRRETERRHLATSTDDDDDGCVGRKSLCHRRCVCNDVVSVRAVYSSARGPWYGRVVHIEWWLLSIVRPWFRASLCRLSVFHSLTCLLAYFLTYLRYRKYGIALKRSDRASSHSIERIRSSIKAIGTIKQTRPWNR